MEQCENIVSLDLKLIQDKFLYEIVGRSGNDLLRRSVLGDVSLIDNQHLVGKRKCFLRIMSDNDRRQMEISCDLLDLLLDGFFDHTVRK